MSGLKLDQGWFMFKRKQQKISGSRYIPVIPGVKDKLSVGYFYTPAWGSLIKRIAFQGKD